MLARQTKAAVLRDASQKYRFRFAAMGCAHTREPPGIRLCSGLETAPEKGSKVLNITPVVSGGGLFGVVFGWLRGLYFLRTYH